ncbi:MAG: S1 family peptidase [Firmicutes bacterium]|nr:S1 family peptidase [Bacillota bacterium]
MEEYYSIEEKENFFIVEHYDGIEPMFSGHIIRGGERASRADLDWFTIGINVVCNYTGDFGILTNEHNVENRTIYRGGAGAFGRTIGSARRSCPDYDAAFIPFENQNNWAPTPFARYGGNFFGNISMGVESLIIEGLPVKRIGITTGISMGTISRQ